MTILSEDLLLNSKCIKMGREKGGFQALLTQPAFTTPLYKRHFADQDLSIPELSPRNKQNRRKLYLQFAESMGQL